MGLVRPRPGVFLEAITYCLVVATTTEIVLLGVCFTKTGGRYARRQRRRRMEEEQAKRADACMHYYQQRQAVAASAMPWTPLRPYC